MGSWPGDGVAAGEKVPYLSASVEAGLGRKGESLSLSACWGDFVVNSI